MFLSLFCAHARCKDDGLLLHDYAPLQEGEAALERAEAEASAAADPPPEGLEELGRLIDDKQL